MSTTTLTTADQLFARPDDGQRYELVSGELRMMSPSGWKHGTVVGKLHGRLFHHVEKQQLGILFGAETGFLIARDPDTVRAPDIAFVAQRNLPQAEPAESYWPGAPDLAVEVLSPNDRTGEVDDKIQAWLAAGSCAVWVVDPKLRTVTIYRSAVEAQIYTADQTLEHEELFPGFQCQVAEIFGILEP